MVKNRKQLRPFPFDHSQNEPYLLNPNFKIEEVVGGLEAPTTMSFLGPDDFSYSRKRQGNCSARNKWKCFE